MERQGSLDTLSLCSSCENYDEKDFTKRKLYCEDQDEDIITCSNCFSELSLEEWDTRLKENQVGHRLGNRSKNLKREKPVPIYVHRQSSFEKYSRQNSKEDNVVRYSPAIRPDFMADREYPQMDREFDISAINDVISFTPCQKCGSSKEAVRGGIGKESPIAWYCKNCNDCTGVDDTFTVPEALELASILAASLEKGTLLIDPCWGGCGNENPERFFVCEVNGQVVTRCLNCYHEEPLSVFDQREDEEEEEEGKAEPYIMCDCGNSNPEIFQVKQIEGTELKLTCLVCDRTIFRQENLHGQNKTGNVNEDLPIYPKTRSYTEVKDLSMLQPGDHIKWDNQVVGYWHHAIVQRINQLEKKIEVIHYNGEIKGPWGEIMQQWISVDCQKDPLHRMDYTGCNPPQVVLERARSRLNEGRYNPFKNNCEHFAQWCKIGLSNSDQVQSFKNFAIAASAKVVSFATKDGVKQAINIIKNVGSRGAAGLQATAENVASATASVARKSAKTVARSIGKMDVAVMGLTVGVEVVRAGKDIYGYHQQRKAGDISESEFMRCTIKRVLQGGGGVVGTVIGSIVGQFIPIPILGGFIGATLGALIGEGLGKLLGRQVNRLVYRK